MGLLTLFSTARPSRALFKPSPPIRTARSLWRGIGIWPWWGPRLRAWLNFKLMARSIRHFAAKIPAGPFVTALLVQADGNLLVDTGDSLFRLNGDGSLDLSFTAPGFSVLRRIFLDHHSRSLIVGDFFINGQFSSGVARLLPN